HATHLLSLHDALPICDLDVLITTNNGPAYLYRNDRIAGNHSIRFRLIGTQSNRDGIGALVRIYYGGQSSSRMVRTGSSYLSQSEDRKSTRLNSSHSQI